MYNQLQVREIFHIEFLRWLGRKVKSEYYALKGGVNLRFFFGSFRYSEDMDIDVRGIKKYALLDAVKSILESGQFTDILKPFGIERIIPPDIARAKQTETTQRFKVHLITYAGEDLFTKVEFSRRGFTGDPDIESVQDTILKAYKLPPLLVPHYNIHAAASQKIEALATRTLAQARDIFDLYVLSSQYAYDKTRSKRISHDKLNMARKRIFEIGFEEFRNTVILYLAPEDQRTYEREDAWDEVKLKVISFLEKIGNEKR